MQPLVRNPASKQIGYRCQVVSDENTIFDAARSKNLVVIGLEEFPIVPTPDVLCLDLRGNLSQCSDGCPGNMNIKEQFHPKFYWPLFLPRLLAVKFPRAAASAS